MAGKSQKAGKSAQTVKPVSSELERLKNILELMGRHGVAELEWEKGGERLKLRTLAGSAAPVVPASAPLQFAPLPAGSAPAPKAATSDAPAAKPASNQKQVVSPFVGTFYRAGSPTSDPYVKEGQSIKRGDTLCIIEAMKLMNEIEAEFGGKIVSVLVENGQPVEFGEPLFLVET